MRKQLLGLVFISILSLAIISLAIISGCSASNNTTPGAASSTTSAPAASTSLSSPSASTPAPSAELSDSGTAADRIMENILVSLGKNDYAGFSRDFAETTKKALDQAAFNQMHDQILPLIGDYQSKVAFSIGKQNNMDVLIYIARYSNELAGVAVTLALKAVDGSYQVEGLNLDSLKLRGKTLDLDATLAYASPETENFLASLSNNDYAGASKDFDPIMKGAVNPDAFTRLYNQVDSVLGKYQSLEFVGANQQNDYIVIRYFAKYSLDPAVPITISFNSAHQISGQFFNTDKLK